MIIVHRRDTENAEFFFFADQKMTIGKNSSSL